MLQHISSKNIDGTQLKKKPVHLEFVDLSSEACDFGRRQEAFKDENASHKDLAHTAIYNVMISLVSPPYAVRLLGLNSEATRVGDVFVDSLHDVRRSKPVAGKLDNSCEVEAPVFG